METCLKETLSSFCTHMAIIVKRNKKNEIIQKDYKDKPIFMKKIIFS